MMLAYTQGHALPYCCVRPTLLPPPVLTQMSPFTQSTLPNSLLPQDISALIPGACEYVTWPGKRDCALQTKHLEMQGYSGWLWHMPITLALGRWSQKDQKSKVSLHYRLRANLEFEVSLGYMRPCLKTFLPKKSRLSGWIRGNQKITSLIIQDEHNYSHTN